MTSAAGSRRASGTLPDASGFALRSPDARQEPRIHARRRPVAGAGHRREHGHLQPDQRRVAAADAGPRRGSLASVFTTDQRNPGNLPLSHLNFKDLREQNAVFSDMAAFTRRSELQRHRGRTDPDADRHGQLLLAARHPAGAGPRVPAGGRRQGDAGRRHQPRLLAAQPRRRSGDRRQDAHAQPEGVHRRRRRAARLHRHAPRRRPAGWVPMSIHVVAQPSFDWYEQRRGSVPLCVRPAQAGRVDGAGALNLRTVFANLEQTFPVDNKGRSAGACRCCKRA